MNCIATAKSSHFPIRVTFTRWTLCLFLADNSSFYSQWVISSSILITSGCLALSQYATDLSLLYNIPLPVPLTFSLNRCSFLSFLLRVWSACLPPEQYNISPTASATTHSQVPLGIEWWRLCNYHWYTVFRGNNNSRLFNWQRTKLHQFQWYATGRQRVEWRGELLTSVIPCLSVSHSLSLPTRDSQWWWVGDLCYNL